jgi:hypothetical protein
MSRNPFETQPDVSPPAAHPLAPGGPAPEETQPAPRSHITSIPTANWKPKKRKRDTRKRAKSRKLSLIQENKRGIEKQANRLNVPEYELVRYLLEYGLDQVANGNLVFESQLSPAGLTLYPREKRRRRKVRSRSRLVNTTYRGIPDETWELLKALASNYPIWQVANKLIEHGIEHLEIGQLDPNPKATGVQTLY